MGGSEMKALSKTTAKWVFNLFLAFFLLAPNAAAETAVTIGTGGVNGVYYPTGINICSMVNAKPEYGITCTAITSGGSVYNINSVLDGSFEFGIAQSDIQHEAWYGVGYWESLGPQQKLRSVYSVHHESVTLIAGSDAGITIIQDLVGKVVNIGPEGTAVRKNAIDALDNAGINYLTDLTPTEYNLNEAIQRLQNYEIDALFITVGHPSGFVQNATQGPRQVYLVPITDVENLIENYPYYAESIIPIHFYPDASNTTDVPTFGVKATFVTSIDIAEDIVYAFAKEVLANFLQFQQLHSAYEALTRNNMLQALTAPIHPGAMKYYKEVIFVNQPKECECDLNYDGKCDMQDWLLFGGNWGRTDCP
jgi:TRAP transporter TAXI family solute receptor